MTFWNKVQQGVGRAAAEAEKQARIARLNMQIGDAESGLKQLKADLGGAALELVRADKLNEPSLTTFVEQIGAQEKKISDLRAELAEIQTGPTTPP